VAARSTAATARCAGATFASTGPAQPRCAAARRQASWTISACLPRPAGAAAAASARSAVVSWPANCAGSPPTAGTLNGAAGPADGRGGDGAAVRCPAPARLSCSAGPPSPATPQPATGPTSTTQTAASNGSQPGDPDTAFNLGPP